MASDASWQTSGAGASRDAFSDDQSMDQRSVESLLRRLVERVEESERRYGEALDELHARLDQLSQTTEAARGTGGPQDTETFDHLQTEVSKLARRFEQDASTSLEDFERLGKALSGSLDRPLHETPSAPFEHEPEPSPFAQAAMAGSHDEPPVSAGPESAFPDFGYAAPRSEFSASSANPEPSANNGADLDKRLVELAQRLEESIGSAMPTSAIETMSARLDAIGGQLNEVVGKAPTCEALEHIERQLSDISQQVSRAEEQLGKIGGIETQLLKLIERLDEKAAAPATADTAQLEEVANKAAAEAARKVAVEAKQSTDKLDAMHRDITTMSDKNRESGDRLASTLEAVHESLKQLVQQVERGAPAFQPKPKAPFLERARQAEAKSSQPQAKAPAPQARPAMPQMAKSTEAQAKTGESAAAPAKQTLRDRLGAAIPDFKETDTPPPFGRSNRLVPEEEAVDLDAAASERKQGSAAPQTQARKPAPSDADKAPEDLVAAARRAAQAAALRAEERGGRRRSKPAVSAGSAEQPGRRKRSVLIIAAAVLLIVSALLLYGRLQTKPESGVTPAPAEETAPAPADAAEGDSPPATDDAAPAADPDQSGWAPMPDTQISPPANVGQATTGFTEMAKSSGRMPDSELSPEPQLASLGPDGEATLPPGVMFSIEDPAVETNDTAATQPATPFAAPAKLPMPPETLGSLALRQAAAEGDSRAQYAIAVRYADGKGTKRDLKEAAKWFELAAGAGLAPAQYRLAAMYERGVGVDKDLGRARTWYAAAAEKGNVKAMHNLAVSVSGRNGGNPNYKLAAKWYGAAAAFGLADSQFNLGILAEHGLGMTKNLSDAYKWFSLAAEKGDAEAAKRRDVIGAQLAPETLAEAKAAAKAWEAEKAPTEANEVVEEAVWAAKASGTKTASLVTRAQTLLNELGYDVGPPDGIAGSRTSTPIKLFQQRNGLPETGEVSDELVTKLEHLSS